MKYKKRKEKKNYSAAAMTQILLEYFPALSWHATTGVGPETLVGVPVQFVLPK